MSAERPKKTRTPESLPEAEGPERKRVLNVLAQRRYRQRRREKIAALEAHAKGVSSPLTTPHEAATQLSPSDGEKVVTDPSFVDSEVLEEVVKPTTENSFAMFDFDEDPFGPGPMQPFHAFTNLPTPIPSTGSPSPPSFPLTSDGAVLDIPALNTTRTFLTIAMAFDVMANMYDPYYLHVLTPSMPALSRLPKNLQPVAAQYSIPHHPMLDLLPWPSVREKLICMLSMPSAFRPPVAQEVDGEASFPCNISSGGGRPSISSSVKQGGAIVSLVHDLDDFQNDGGGLRVHGNSSTWSDGNELLEDAWEIGDHFYRKWWWCLDQRVVDASNRRRLERGLGRLRMVA